MFKKLTQKIKRSLCFVLASALCFTGAASLGTVVALADEDTSIKTYADTIDDLSPTIYKDGSTWYYYANGVKDLTYTGLATNENGTYWCEDGVVTFKYDDSFGGGGNGGWKIEGSKVSVGGNVTVKEDKGNYLADDNSFTGKFIIGDSRNEQMYEYNSYVNYAVSSINATWGGKYDPDSPTYTTTGNGKLDTMMSYAKESLECLGYCDVYLFSSINDTQQHVGSSGQGVGTEDPGEGTGWEISAATSIAGVTATFNGQTVKPTMHIIAMINGAGNYDVTSRGGSLYVTTWNNLLQSACTTNGWEFLDWTSCLGGSNSGYNTDNIHYNTTTLGNLWGKVSECPHEYKTYTNAASCISTGRTSEICIKCGDVSSTRVLDKTDHTYDSGKVTTEPTCTTDGVKTYTCTVCGATKTESIAATGHTWGEGVVTLEPTATEDGVMTYTCTKCGETKTEEIAATGETGNDGNDGNDGDTGEKIDKSALAAEISTVEAGMSGLTKDDYTDSSWTALADALADAQSVYDNEDASQAEVDNALSDLELAWANLTKTDSSADDNTGDDSGTTSGGNTTGDDSGDTTTGSSTTRGSTGDTDTGNTTTSSSDDTGSGNDTAKTSEQSAKKATSDSNSDTSSDEEGKGDGNGTEVVKTGNSSYAVLLAAALACAGAAATLTAALRRRAG